MEKKLYGEMLAFPNTEGVTGGYLVKAQGTEKRPGLIVIHEWRGLNDHIKELAGRFAAQGYVVLAPDLYDGVTTKDPEEAGKLMQGLAKEKALRDLQGAVAFLQQQPEVKPEAIGVSGFCMGGTYSLLLACYTDKVKASVPFYGDIPSEEELAKLSAPRRRWRGKGFLDYAGEDEQAGRRLAEVSQRRNGQNLPRCWSRFL